MKPQRKYTIGLLRKVLRFHSSKLTFTCVRKCKLTNRIGDSSNPSYPLYCYENVVVRLLDRKLVSESELEYKVCSTLVVELESFGQTDVIAEVEDEVVLLV